MKKILILLTIFLISCDNDMSNSLRIDKQNEKIYTDEFKQNLIKSQEFNKISELNKLFLNEIIVILQKDEKVRTQILSSSKDDLKVNEVLFFLNSSNLYKDYIKNIQSAFTSFDNKYPEFSLSESESVEYFEDLMTNYKFDPIGSAPVNPCQQAFDRQISYIHGQYDARVFGAAIAFIGSGGTTAGISLLTLGYAVVSAIWDIANAIDDYNACMNI